MKAKRERNGSSKKILKTHVFDTANGSAPVERERDSDDP